MELDATTIALEIFNFLVLLWVLQRFLYRPLRSSIAQRQAQQVAALAAATTREQAAAAQQAEYEQRLQQWETERAAQLEQQQQQWAEQAQVMLAQARAAAAAETQRLDALRAQTAQQREQQQQQQAIAAALALSTRLLQRLASPALDRECLRLLTEDLAALDTASRARLQQALQHNSTAVTVAAAHPLDAATHTQLQLSLRSLQTATGDNSSSDNSSSDSSLTDSIEVNLRPIEVNLQVVPELISGFRISLGADVLHANLADELDFFKRNLQRNLANV